MDYTPREPRYVTNEIAVLKSASGEVEGLMVDVHEDGAKLQTSIALRESEKVTLVFLHHEIAATVLWQRDNRIGLQFASPISSEIVQALSESGDGWMIV